MKLGKWTKAMVGTLVLVMCLAPMALAGGVLKVAVSDEPPALDQQVITSDLATMIAQHMFEGLYTFDSTYKPVPMLAEGADVKNGGKLISLKLRQGVKFHNGGEMTSADVVASLQRWGKFGSRGPVLFATIEKVEAAGKYQVDLYFKEVFGPWQSMLAFINGGPVIHPKAIMEKADKKPIDIKDYIGTGPYKMGRWNPGRFVELIKFEEYAARSDAANGYAGQRVAKIDTLHFIPVPDVSTRINGLKAGDYHYAEQIPGDLFDDLDKDPIVNTVVNTGPIFGEMFFNSKEGIMKGNYKLRQAVQAAMDLEPALMAAIGPKSLWAANGSIMPKGTFWYTEAGVKNYSQGDADLAKKLAEEAGYKGEIIKFMVSTAYPHHYDTAVVVAKQMSQAGFKVDLQIYDWATLISKRGNPKMWDMFFTHHGFVPDPILFSFMSETYPGWWATKEKLDLKAAFTSTTDQAKRKEIWSKLQSLMYDQVPIVKNGDIFTYNIATPKLTGVGKSSLIWPQFWNCEIK